MSSTGLLPPDRGAWLDWLRLRRTGLAALLVSLMVLLAITLQPETDRQILERDYGIRVSDTQLLFGGLALASALWFARTAVAKSGSVSFAVEIQMPVEGCPSKHQIACVFSLKMTRDFILCRNMKTIPRISTEKDTVPKVPRQKGLSWLR
ncbi:MAG: hypothetical protein HPY64_04710 [Anaerolineae bacterium]|nr:hypothetical protein [Anaerolineae bacterium]